MRYIDHLLFREITNTIWAQTSLAIVVVLGFYLWERLKEDGFYNDTATRLAIAFFFYHVGSAVYRAWIAALLYVQDKGALWFDPEDHIWVGFISAMSAFLGGLCVIRVFTPVVWPKWKRNLPWFVTFLLGCATAVYLGVIEGVLNWP